MLLTNLKAQFIEQKHVMAFIYWNRITTNIYSKSTEQETPYQLEAKRHTHTLTHMHTNKNARISQPIEQSLSFNLFQSYQWSETYSKIGVHFGGGTWKHRIRLSNTRTRITTTTWNFYTDFCNLSVNELSLFPLLVCFIFVCFILSFFFSLNQIFNVIQDASLLALTKLKKNRREEYTFKIFNEYKVVKLNHASIIMSFKQRLSSHSETLSLMLYILNGSRLIFYLFIETHGCTEVQTQLRTQISLMKYEYSHHLSGKHVDWMLSQQWQFCRIKNNPTTQAKFGGEGQRVYKENLKRIMWPICWRVGFIIIGWFCEFI